MARAIWSGAISFGLVNVPVKLYSAVSRKTVRFHQLNGETQKRIQQKRVDAGTGEEVPYESLVKGYEISPERYVVITPAELDALDPATTRSIDILDFVGLSEIDPIYYDQPYYLAPQAGAAKAYGLLRDAMQAADKVGIAKVVLRSKESLVAIRPVGRVLTMETMLYADEVVSPDALEDLPDAATADAAARELKMAEQLIASLTTEFDPSRYRDGYRERVMDLIERKAQGEEIVVEAPTPAPAKVPDLMAALEASIKAVKERGTPDLVSARPGAPKRVSAKRGATKQTPAKRAAAGKAAATKRKVAAKPAAVKLAAAKPAAARRKPTKPASK